MSEFDTPREGERKIGNHILLGTNASRNFHDFVNFSSIRENESLGNRYFPVASQNIYPEKIYTSKLASTILTIYLHLYSHYRKGKRDVSSPRSPRPLTIPQSTPATNLPTTPSDEASRYAEYTGPDTYKKPSGKSNRKIMQNAIMHCCLCGEVNKEAKRKCLEVK